MATLTTDTAAPTNPQTISNANGTHDIEQGPDSYNTDLIKAAHREGFIYIDDLVVVLACETGFTQKHLPGLWEKFDLKKKGDDFGPLSDSRWRFNRWMRLLYRIAFGISIDKSRVDVLSASMFRKLVPKHKYDNGEYLPADLGHFKKGDHNYGECFIKIDDLRDYLTGYAGIPAEDLPGSLFPPVVISEPMTGVSTVETKKTPQKHTSKIDLVIEKVGEDTLREMVAEIGNLYLAIQYIPGSDADASEQWDIALRQRLETTPGFKHIDTDIINSLEFAYSSSNKKRDFQTEVFRTILKRHAHESIVPSGKLLDALVKRFTR
jgi:hypothetical protein